MSRAQNWISNYAGAEYFIETYWMRRGNYLYGDEAWSVQYRVPAHKSRIGWALRRLADRAVATVYEYRKGKWYEFHSY